MTAYFFSEIPDHQLSRFCAVRNSLDNLSNILKLVEIINTYPNHLKKINNGFEIAVFSGQFRRAVIKKPDGFFSMSIPFQLIDFGDRISFNSDSLGEEVSGLFISIMRNAIETTKLSSHSHEDIILSFIENFNLELYDAIRYYDAFASLISEDHGYFRFDDDTKNENGDIHPRYHFDIFYKDSTTIKIGYDKIASIDCFYSLVDSSLSKQYLVKK